MSHGYSCCCRYILREIIGTMLLPMKEKHDYQVPFEDDRMLMYVNRSGFPMDEKTWERMWDHAAKHHPEGDAITRIRSCDKLPQVPYCQSVFKQNLPIHEKIKAIQKYMESLEYNYTGTQIFEIKKSRPVCGLMDCARVMIQESLPIKCLEAVVLGIYLTNGMEIERFPIGFKSSFRGVTKRHVVLGLYSSGRYGALGMSRRDKLMYKPLEYKNLSDLILDYQDAYKNYCHNLLKIKIGLPVSHKFCSYEYIQWSYTVVHVNRLSAKEIFRKVEQYSKEMRKSGEFHYHTKSRQKTVKTLAT